MATSTSAGATIAIVGAGPRGVSVLERLGTALNALPIGQQPNRPITIELIDKVEVGSGAIWQIQQTRTLCKNTLAGAVTLFTEPGASITQPVFSGPTIWEWVRLSRGDNPAAVNTQSAELYRHFPTDSDVVTAFAEEFATTTIDSHPSRALYGAYLHWCLQVAEARLPEYVKVNHRVATVVSINDSADGQDIVRFDDGSAIAADATVLAYGWSQPAPTPSETQLADTVAQTDLYWVQHGNPVEQPVTDVPAGEQVLVRGLGMGFFDLMALVTVNRGGKFIPDESTRSGLIYVPAGSEPRLAVCSGRGYPYLPKSEYGSLPPAPKLYRTRSALAEIADDAPQGSVDFAAEIWPALARDAHESYYRTLLQTRPAAISGSIEELVSILDASDVGRFDEGLTTAVACLVPNANDRLSLTSQADRVGEVQLAPQQFTEYIAAQVAGDLRDARAARRSPVKNALWELAASRKAVGTKFAGGRATADSRSLLAAYFALARQAGSGPPAFRTRQLLALVDAGLVTFIGKRPQLRIEQSSAEPGAAEFVLTSPATQGHEFRSKTLVDAWMYSPDIRRPGSELEQQLVLDGRLRPFMVPELNGAWAATGSPEIDPVSHRAVGANGAVDPRLHVIGIPMYAQLADTAISPAPGTDSTLLQETDAAATSLLHLLVPGLPS